MPEEVSRKHGSRIRRLARPDVSQARRPATSVSQGVSQGQRSRDRRFARTGVPTSLFSSYFSSMLVRLSTLWFGFCLLWSFNLSFDKLPEEVSPKHGSRNRRLARTGVPTFLCDPPASTEVSQQMSRKDRRLDFYFACSSSEAFVWLLYLLLSFTLSFCKFTAENSRKQRGLATDVSQGQTSTDGSQGQTSRDRRFARTGVPTSLFSSYFSSMLVRLSTFWFGFCLLWSFNLSFYKLPEEVSRKHGSRNRRLARTDVCNDARPDVSQQTSRKDRRTYFLLRSTGKHRGLATDVSQRQASLLLFRLFIF